MYGTTANKIIRREWPFYVMACTECGKEFNTKRVHQMTCSSKCRKRRERRIKAIGV